MTAWAAVVRGGCSVALAGGEGNISGGDLYIVNYRDFCADSSSSSAQSQRSPEFISPSSVTWPYTPTHPIIILSMRGGGLFSVLYCQRLISSRSRAAERMICQGLGEIMRGDSPVMKRRSVTASFKA
ncbi:hypothetical protein PBY51_022077 [Eleginops maclovinus]|uniref:Uncharacterized protein n=1 Tax=Eleginops maclovinus TaxID=56733 RepID=A0AAN7XI05_ELEMC|nr:hypothetical protein PBY51_022077 [Eleginops maclovinus]